MKIKDRINQIVKLREDLLDELKNLQKSCSHDEYHIGTFSYRIGSYNTMKICEECGKILGTPSNEEIQDFNNEIESGIGQGTKIYKNNV